MAKKTVSKKKAAPATKKATPAKKGKKAASPKKPAKATKKTPMPPVEEEPMELILDEVEQQAVNLVATSDPLCDELELAVTSAVAKIVRTVYKKHKINLTAAQAENVALVLFGN
jgi:hypothetical protein